MEVKKHMQDFLSADKAVANAAAQWLTMAGASPEIFEFLVAQLKNARWETRNLAALTLCNLGNNAAVAPFVEAIRDPKFKDCQGTLVYALGKLDFSAHLAFMVELMACGNFEVRQEALAAVQESLLEFPESQIEQAIYMAECYQAQAANDEEQSWQEVLVTLRELQE